MGQRGTRRKMDKGSFVRAPIPFYTFQVGGRAEQGELPKINPHQQGQFQNPGNTLKVIDDWAARQRAQIA